MLILTGTAQCIEHSALKIYELTEENTQAEATETDRQHTTNLKPSTKATDIVSNTLKQLRKSESKKRSEATSRPT
jgi:hypothetical protein